MKNFGALHKTYLHFATLFTAMIVFAFSQAQSQNVEHQPQVVSTLRSIDTLRTDTSEIITRTYNDTITKIDSSFTKPNSMDVKKAVESFRVQFKESLESSAESSRNWALSLDSIHMNNFLDSMITVSYTDLDVAIAKLDKCAAAADTTSIRKGLDVLIKMVNLESNGRKLDASFLNPVFLSTVSISEIKETTAYLRTKIDQLRKLKKDTSGVQKAAILSNLLIDYFQDKLIARTFENVLYQGFMQDNQACYQTVTTTVVQTRTESSETLINTSNTQP